MEAYNNDYFEYINREEKSQADALGYTLIELFHPESVLDLGCATGLYLKPFLNKGIEVFGVDFAPAAMELAVIPREYLSLQDLTRSLKLPRSQWDLLLCIEVLEHIAEEYADDLVAKLCTYGSVLVITIAGPGQEDRLHINLQPKAYWLDKFAAHGYQLDEIMTMQIIGRMEVIEDRMPWLDKNLMVLSRHPLIEEISNAPYRKLVSPQTLKVLDEMIWDIGWMGTTDSCALSLLAAFMAITKPRKVIEIGTWIGLATIVIADVISPQGELFTIDINTERQQQAKEYISEAGLHNVMFLNGNSQDAEILNFLLNYAPYDALYIDASHNYQETLRELKVYHDLVSGYIFLHDASEFARRFDPKGEGGVRKALDEWLTVDCESMILEPPRWPNKAGFAILRRR